MAGIPLNTFKTFVKNVQRPNKWDYETSSYSETQSWFPIDNTNGLRLYPPTPSEPGYKIFEAYVAPLGVTSVVLYAHVSTISNSPRQLSLWHYRPRQYPVGFTQLLNNILVPSNDALVAIGGKLVLQTDDALIISCLDAEAITVDPVNPANFITDVKLTLSILETANQ
jgi:hypothetical protein